MTLATKIIRTSLILQFLLCGLFTFGQNTTTPSSIHQSVQSHTDKIFDSLVRVRRDFHSYPEVSEQEQRTSDKVAAYLTSLGLEVKTAIGGYGVVGILNGNMEGKRIAWRADIDAMASDIPDVVGFPSKNKGVRHICGHDVHTTIGLGIADVLASVKNDLNGTVYFIFQPAEEMATGAKDMIADGLFDIIKPDEIYGLHITPFSTGTILTKPENIYAHRTFIEVIYKNSNKTEAAIAYTKEVMSGLQTYGPEHKFWDEANRSNPNLGIVSPNTLYKNYIAVRSDFHIDRSDTELKIRTLTDASNMNQLNTFLESVKKKIKQSSFSEDLLSVEFSYVSGAMKTPINDKVLTTKAMNSISAIYGEENVIPMYGVGPGQFGDDFIFFQNQIPGVYFYLGGSDYEKGLIAMPHTPNFAVDEECIRTGVNYFSSMIIERLND